MKVGIYVRCKDEKNIIEFMNHYYGIGFDFIFFLDHNSKIPINEVIGDLFKKNTFHILKYEGNLDNLNNSIFFNNNILPIIKKNMDYCFYVDMDEYLVLKKFHNIQNVILHYQPFDMLKINWLLFGNNNIKKIDNNLTLKEKFTMSSNIFNPHVKSLAKVSSIKTAYNPHFFMLDDKKCIIKNIFNNLSPEDPFDKEILSHEINDVNIYLAHYVVQDTCKFILRRFGRITDNINCLKIKNLEHFIKMLNDNIDKIIDYFHDDISSFDKYFTDIPDVKYYENEIKSIKGFFNSHNSNNVQNLDVLSTTKIL